MKRIPKIGFLITHGTDTMAWTLAALSYSLKNFPCNLVITGSQLPMEALFSASDAYPNLGASIHFLLTLRGPNILAVFNHGKSAYQYSLWKINKWEPDAFYGNELAIRNSVDYIYAAKIIREKRDRIDKLYILRTGGTIESELSKAAFDVLHPTDENLVGGFLSDKYSRFAPNRIDVKSDKKLEITKDSSDIVPSDWKKFSESVAHICEEQGYTTYAECKFNESVRIVNCAPFLTTADYARLFEDCEGIIIAGYGGGNINIRRDENHSPLPVIEKAVKKNKIVVLGSQVALGATDFIYENALKAIDARKSPDNIPIPLAIPEGNFGLARAQVKLSYILGYSDIIDQIAESIPQDHAFSKIAEIERSYLLKKLAFLSGIQFRDPTSKPKLEEILNKYYGSKIKDFTLKVPDYDPFFNTNFKEAMKKILDEQKRPVICVMRYEGKESIEDVENKALIIKQEEFASKNCWGEPIDAAFNLSQIIKQCFGWNSVIFNLEEIEDAKYNIIFNLLKKCKIAFFEAGANLLDENYELTKYGHQYCEFIVQAMKSIGCTIFVPFVFIGNTHFVLIFALLKNLLTHARKIVSEKSDKSNKMQSIIDQANAYLKRPSLFIESNIALGHNIVTLHKYDLSAVPQDYSKLYQTISECGCGLVEDAIEIDKLDVATLDTCCIKPEVIHFLNKSYKIIRDSCKDFILVGKIPWGIEITSSADVQLAKTLIKIDVCSIAIYWQDYHRNKLYKYLSFQFHPELTGLDIPRTLPEDDIHSFDLSFKNDGLKILFSAILTSKTATPIIQKL